MLKTNLEVGQEVVLSDVWSGKDGGYEKGTGYKVTAITKNFVECSNPCREDHNRTKFYGKNDLHLINPVTKVA